MGTFRLYTGPDGQSHIEPIDIEQEDRLDQGAGDDARSRSARARSATSSTGIPRPRRQFVIILSGQLEIGLGDGSKHVFGPGDARLVEDTTGQGPHHARARQPAVPHRHHPSRAAMSHGHQDPLRRPSSPTRCSRSRARSPPPASSCSSSIPARPSSTRRPPTPSTTWASPARWAASSSAPRPKLKLVQLTQRGLRPRGHRGGAQGQGAGVQQRRGQLRSRWPSTPHADAGRAQARGAASTTTWWPASGGSADFADQRVYELAGKTPRHRGPRQHRQEGRAARGRPSTWRCSTTTSRRLTEDAGGRARRPLRAASPSCCAPPTW